MTINEIITLIKTVNFSASNREVRENCYYAVDMYLDNINLFYIDSNPASSLYTFYYEYRVDYIRFQISDRIYNIACDELKSYNNMTVEEEFQLSTLQTDEYIWCMKIHQLMYKIKAGGSI